MVESNSRIRHLRKAKGVSQNELAAAAGIAQSVVSRLETGEAKMWRGYARRISAVLGCSPDDLL